MKETINRTHITVLALLYNYISNKNDFLGKCQIDNFEYLINLELYKERQNTLISCYEEPQDIYYSDNGSKTISLKDKNYFLGEASRYIESIPKHIILTSLKDDILCTLDVDKDKIQIVTNYKHVNSFIDVFSLSAKDALKKAKECLESYGYKNIEIHAAYSEQKYGDKTYHVIVSYDVETISFAMNSNDKKTFKKCPIK